MIRPDSEHPAQATCLLIGLGARSLKRHLPALVRSREVELVGVCDTDPGLAALVPAGVPFFGDVDAALAAVRPTMAIVSTPHHTHFSITTRLLEAGAAVLKEKPFAIDLDQARRLAHLIEQQDGFVRVAVQRQFSPVFTAARSALTAVGALRHFEAIYHLNTAPYADTWRGDRERAGGGALLDMGYHTLDLIVSYFGLPRSVRAVRVPGRAGSDALAIEESVAAILEYESGFVGRLFLSRCEARKQESFSVTGTEGSFTAEPGALRRRDAHGTEIEVVTEGPAAADESEVLIASFLESMGDQRVVQEERRRGLQVMILTEALYASIRERSAITLDDEAQHTGLGSAALVGTP